MEIAIAMVLGIIAAVANLVFLWYWKGVEKKESDAGRIPPRMLVPGNGDATIRYLADSLSFRVGDRYALSVMDFAIAFVLYTRGLPSVQRLMVCVVIGLAWAAVSQTFQLFRHEPDSSSPGKMRVSKVGWVHLPYYTVQYIAGFIGLAVVYSMVRSEVPWSPLAIVGLAGAGVYFLIPGWKAVRKRH